MVKSRSWLSSADSKSKKPKNHKKVKELLKNIKISKPVAKDKKTSETEKEQKEKQEEQEIKEDIRSGSFHETILNEDIGFTAPVIDPRFNPQAQNQNQAPLSTFNALESTASTFISPSPIKDEGPGLNYANQKAAGDYSGSGSYMMGDNLKYSSETEFTPLGMGAEPLSSRTSFRKDDVFNPFNEERNKRSDTNWGSKTGELEEFTRIQQQEQIEKEKKKRQSSQFA